jgi:hypothetical protein
MAQRGIRYAGDEEKRGKEEIVVPAANTSPNARKRAAAHNAKGSTISALILGARRQSISETAAAGGA